jgi:hypothetical protein
MTMHHYEHEAFRFKFKVDVLQKIENHIIGKITVLLYINWILYYIMLFVIPLYYMGECGKGLDITTTYIFVSY